MARWLRRQGECINRKRVQRLMRRMGLEAIYQKPNLSRAAAGHRLYPYLLRHLAVTRPNQVWAKDITSVPVQGGYAYLCAVLDWHSRGVLAWERSNTLDAGFCARAVQLGKEIETKGEHPAPPDSRANQSRLRPPPPESISSR